MIEKGRHIRPKIEAKDRICAKCNTNTVEDEYHYIIDCPHYNGIRKKLFSSIQHKCTSFNLLSNENKFINIISNKANAIDPGLYLKESGIF